MIEIWIDAQLSPALAKWINETFSNIRATSLRKLGLRDAEDRKIFEAARLKNAVIMSKDSDFVSLVNQFGPPPQVIWVRCGNTSNARMYQVLKTALPEVMRLLSAGEILIELKDK